MVDKFNVVDRSGKVDRGSRREDAADTGPVGGTAVVKDPSGERLDVFVGGRAAVAEPDVVGRQGDERKEDGDAVANEKDGPGEGGERVPEGAARLGLDVEDKSVDGGGCDGETEDGCDEEKGQKGPVVSPSDTVSDPGAVVVKRINTVVAHRAV